MKPLYVIQRMEPPAYGVYCGYSLKAGKAGMAWVGCSTMRQVYGSQYTLTVYRNCRECSARYGTGRAAKYCSRKCQQTRYSRVRRRRLKLHTEKR